MENQNKEKNNKKIVKLVLDIVFYCIIALLFILSLAALGKTDLDEVHGVKVNNIFGRGYSVVQSDSMAGNRKDSFTTKDIITLKVITNKNKEKRLAKIEVGDIISFDQKVTDAEGDQVWVLVSHRVVDIKVENGHQFFITEGDARADNGYPYQTSMYDDEKMRIVDGYEAFIEKIDCNNVRAVYTGKVKGLGTFFKFISTQKGFGLCVLLPIILFFLYELVLFILGLQKMKNNKTDEEKEAERQRILEEERARIRAEILAEEAAKQAENNKTAEEENKEE